ncbi:MAG: manganese efflux pump MntP [Treponema sp.]
MNTLLIFGIAVSLLADAFTVAITQSMLTKDLSFIDGFRMAAFFGVFQCIMPIIGWAAGVQFASYIAAIDHWIAFLLLSFVGGKMIFEALPFGRHDTGADDPTHSTKDCRNVYTLFLLAIATSIDALAVGLTFAMVQRLIVIPSIIVGATAFAISFMGYLLGKRINSMFAVKPDIFGGIILIAIGSKILIEHTLGSC